MRAAGVCDGRPNNNIALPRNNCKHYTDAMSLSVRLEFGTVGDNEWSGFAQSAKSVYARPTSHYSCAARLLYYNCFVVVMLRLLHRLLIRFDLKVEVSHWQEFSKVIRRRRWLPNCARRLLEN